MLLRDFLILLFFSSCFGTIMGAYFGTVQHRISACEPLVTSYCYCPSCKNRLSILLQIPIISWVLLRGKCYYCGKEIPKKYPLTEGFFLLFYLVSFLLFHDWPVGLIMVWLLFILLVLLIHFPSHEHLKSVVRAFVIFFVYHLIYGSVLAIILVAVK